MYKKREETIERYKGFGELHQEKDFSIVTKNKLDIVSFEILNDVYNLQQINQLFPHYINALNRPDFNNKLVLNDFNELIFLIFKSMAISIREFNDYMYILSKKQQYKPIFDKIKNCSFLKRIICQKAYFAFSQLLHNSSYITSTKPENFYKNDKYWKDLLYDCLNKFTLEEIKNEMEEILKEFKKIDNAVKTRSIKMDKFYDHPAYKLIVTMMDEIPKTTIKNKNKQ